MLYRRRCSAYLFNRFREVSIAATKQFDVCTPTALFGEMVVAKKPSNGVL